MGVPVYQYGDVRPRKATVATAQVVQVGDVCAMVANTIIPGASFTWDTNLATTQGEFAVDFLGIALQAKLSSTLARIFGNSEDNVIMIGAGGIWEFDCVSATYELGDRVGLGKDTGNNLLSQTVAAVATDGLMIGRVVQRGTTITRVKVELLSNFSPAARQS